MNKHKTPSQLFRISRSGPAGGRAGDQIYRVLMDGGMTILDALFRIQREQDPSISFRCSCRVGMCGTCALSVNGIPRLACRTRVESLHTGEVRLAPLPHLPVLKDLIVSMEPFFEKWKKVLPALHPSNPDSGRLACIPQASAFSRETEGKRDCITCGACFAACGIKGMNRGYLGPAALNKAFLRLMDPRDEDKRERLDVVNEEYEGVWRCHTQFNCEAVCPKGIDLTDTIVRLKRAMLSPRRFWAS